LLLLLSAEEASKQLARSKQSIDYDNPMEAIKTKSTIFKHNIIVMIQHKETPLSVKRADEKKGRKRSLLTTTKERRTMIASQ